MFNTEAILLTDKEHPERAEYIQNYCTHYVLLVLATRNSTSILALSLSSRTTWEPTGVIDLAFPSRHLARNRTAPGAIATVAYGTVRSM